VVRYQTPERLRSLWQAANSIVPFIALWYLMYRSLAISYILTLLLAIPTAGFMVRTFIIFHDCGHGSFFKSRQGNDTMGFITGILTLTPYYQWRHTHAVHHATAGDLDRRGTGDVLTLTITEYKALPWWKKFAYRTMRNPLIMFTIGSFLVFTVAHRFWRPGAGKREVWSVIWTNLALAAIVIGLSLTIGWKAFVLVEAPVVFIATAVGVWLFYVQHNFDRTYWERHEKWDFFKAGLNGSSFYKLPGILQWFTGNIGFHHIHHVSPKIPNYKLPQAYKENPVFHIQPLTLLSSLKSMRYRLWDEERKMLVGFKALKGASKRLEQA
jgi:omega-6 fatty acid desaturase (delta-12 desaturase)